MPDRDTAIAIVVILAGIAAVSGIILGLAHVIH
jgi:hypothetical protein